jgi:thioredoxin-dependent peroxiredoxin
MMRTLLLSIAVLGASACATSRPDGGSGLLPVGADAPDFEARDASDQPLKLSSAQGKLAVVYFYPKDETPGCTKQACELRDAYEDYQKNDVLIFGVSRDSQESHRKFRESHQLPFPLVADESGAVQEAYGVPSKLPGMASRVSFLVDRKGKIAKVWPDVDPALHAEQVLSAARELK